MKKKIIEQIKQALEERKEIFLREEDIKLYLAQKFAEIKEYDDIFMEYHIPIELLEKKNIDYPWNNKNNIYIDIVLEKDNSFYPIEIKYKTKSQELNKKIFGEVGNIKLKKQGAQVKGCYSFWKDVKRIEIFEQLSNNVKEGVVLFITNDTSYINKPSNEDVGYANFSIHQDQFVQSKPILKWKGKESKFSKKLVNIELKNSYKINWIEMKNLNSELKFRYILL